LAASTFVRLVKLVLPALDFFLVPVAIAATLVMKFIRSAGIQRLPRTMRVFRRLGIYPLRDHYYEPLFNPVHLSKPLGMDRELLALDLNVDGQRELLTRFKFNHELLEFPLTPPIKRGFYYDNGSFESGDAEYLYNVIRLFRPRRIFEIGSGQSTLLAVGAVQANRRDDPDYTCEHICVEPYEAPWLEELNVKVIREPVEQIDKALFRELGPDDILFIDSSHMIRPQGDVLFEYLEILPILQPGVLVHIHDIFTPKDYPKQWIFEEARFWNEQYLLEAFLGFNPQFKVIGALNFLRHHYPTELASCCPVLQEQMDTRQPGSFWITRI
jgi:hypothetical protein